MCIRDSFKTLHQMFKSQTCSCFFVIANFHCSLWHLAFTTEISNRCDRTRYLTNASLTKAWLILMIHVPCEPDIMLVKCYIRMQNKENVKVLVLHLPIWMSVSNTMNFSATIIIKYYNLSAGSVSYICLLGYVSTTQPHYYTICMQNWLSYVPAAVI